LRDDELQLIARGNVWRYHHHKPLIFTGIEEEANFYKRIGRTQQIRNKETHIYRFTIEEALLALQNGEADSISVESMFGLIEPMVCVWKFLDEEVGKRVRAKTLEGFADVLQKKQ